MRKKKINHGWHGKSRIEKKNKLYIFGFRRRRKYIPVLLRERSACPVKCNVYLTGVVNKYKSDTIELIHKKIVTYLTLLA
jgi:hypothetical protein